MSDAARAARVNAAKQREWACPHDGRERRDFSVSDGGCPICMIAQTAALTQERDAIKDAFIQRDGQYQDLERQTAALRAALEKRDALLRDIAADNDPRDGCAYADLASAILGAVQLGQDQAGANPEG